MTTPPPGKVLYYPVWIAPGRKEAGWSWGRPCDTPQEAGAIARERIKDGCPMSCVVEFAGGERTPKLNLIYPETARKACRRWDELWECTDTEVTSSGAT